MPATEQTTLHPVSKLAEQYRTALLKRERAASLDLLTRYGHAWQRTHALSQALIAELEAKRLAGLKITNGVIQQNERYKALLAQLEDEMRRLTPYTEMVVRGGQYAAITAADAEALALARAGIAGIPEPAKDALFNGWNRLPTETAETLVGVLQDGSPLSTLLQPLGAQTVKGIGDALTTGIVLGHNPEKIAQSLRDAFGLTTTRSLRVARTEVLRAYRTAHIMAYRENPQIVKGWRWVASKSLRTCIACIWLDGTLHTLDEFMPQHVNCVTGDTLVSAPSGIIAATRRWYDGEIVEIRCRSGKRLTVTPNHPILTPQGWIGAGSLHEGDDLVADGHGEGVLTGKPDHEYIPTPIEQIFGAQRQAAGVLAVSVPGAAADFHGDGRNAQVEIIRANGLLGARLDAAFSQPTRKLDFSRGAPQAQTLDRLSLLALDGFRFGPAPHSRVRSLGVAPILFGGAQQHHGPIGFGNGAGYNSGPKQTTADSSPTDAITLSQSILGLAGQIPLDRVIGIERRQFSGHVYNLQTQDGWYSSNGIITHNCRCTPVPVTPTWAELGIQGLPDLPAPETGQAWFMGLNRTEQQQILGGPMQRAWEAGAIKPADFWRWDHDPTWGSAPQVNSLKSVLGDGAAEFYG